MYPKEIQQFLAWLKAKSVSLRFVILLTTSLQFEHFSNAAVRCHDIQPILDISLIQKFGGIRFAVRNQLVTFVSNRQRKFFMISTTW